VVKIAKLIDGKKLSAEIKSEIKAEVEKMQSEKGMVPGIGVILVGENPASKVYVASKERGCAEVGIKSESIKMPDTKMLMVFTLLTLENWLHSRIVLSRLHLQALLRC